MATVEEIALLKEIRDSISTLNGNMFGISGVRPGAFNNPMGIPGSSSGGGMSSVRGMSHEDSVKLIASNELLSRGFAEQGKNLRNLIQEFRKNSADLMLQSSISLKLFSEGTKNFTAKELDQKLPAQLKSLLSKSLGNNSLLVRNLNDYAGVVRVLYRADYSNIEKAREIHKLYTEQILDEEHASAELRMLGFSVEELAADARSSGKILDKESKEAAKALGQVGEHGIAAASAANVLGQSLKVIGAIAGAIGGAEFRTATASMKYGTNFSSLDIARAQYMGLSGPQLVELQHENIQAIRSSGMSFRHYTGMLESGSSALATYTGSFAEGAKVTAAMFGTFRSISDVSGDQASFMRDQQTIFEQLNRTVGMTGSQFIDLNKFMLNNTDVQAELFKVSSRRREQVIKGIELGYQQLTLAGLSEEQAKQVIATTEKLMGAGAQTRVVEAAKIQGYMGAMGLGALGSQIGQIVRLGQNASPAQRAQLAKDVAEAQRAIHARYRAAGNNLGEQMPLDILTKALEPLGLGAHGAAAAAGYSVGRAQSAIVHSQAITNHHLMDVVKGVMRLHAVIKEGDSNITTAIRGAIETFLMVSGAKELGPAFFKYGGNKIATFISRLKGGAAAAPEVEGAAAAAAGGAADVAGGVAAVAEGGALASLLAVALPVVVTAVIGGGALVLIFKAISDSFFGGHLLSDIEHKLGFGGKTKKQPFNVNDYRTYQSDLSAQQKLLHEKHLTTAQQDELNILTKELAPLKKEFAEFNKNLKDIHNATQQVKQAVKQGTDQSHIDKQAHMRHMLQEKHRINTRQSKIVTPVPA